MAFYPKLYNIMKKTYNIFIVGTTSIGKTKLSLILADHLKGEVVSCDSMQLYKHADIMTAKATIQEQKAAKHHMIDLIELEELGFNRNKYYDYSKQVFDRLHLEGKCPIVVGGTNYYIQTLLFQNQMSKETQQEAEISEKVKQKILLQKQKFQKLDMQQRYEMICEVDPIIAAKLHKNDHQRINNYLGKYFSTFRKPSETYQLPTYKLRDPNTIVFWIRNQDRDQLRLLIKKRVDSMIDINGIAQIVSIFYYLENCNKNQGGVLQSIGYKQFKEYVEALKLQIPQQAKQNYQKTYSYVKQKLKNINLELYQPILTKCKEELVLSTSQYAKRQITWIKNRLFGSKLISNNFFILDIAGKGDISQRYDVQVRDKALQIISVIDKEGFGYIKGGLSDDEIQKIQKYGDVKKIGQWKKFTCELCEKQMNGKLQFDQHNRSSHHKKLWKLKKKQENRIHEGSQQSARDQ